MAAAPGAPPAGAPAAGALGAAAAAGPPPRPPRPLPGPRAARFHQKKILEWGRPVDGDGAATNVERNGEASTFVFFKWDKTPSFSSSQNIRLQRVLEVASNKLLAEKVNDTSLPDHTRCADPNFTRSFLPDLILQTLYANSKNLKKSTL